MVNNGLTVDQATSAVSGAKIGIVWSLCGKILGILVKIIPWGMNTFPSRAISLEEFDV